MVTWRLNQIGVKLMNEDLRTLQYLYNNGVSLPKNVIQQLSKAQNIKPLDRNFVGFNSDLNTLRYLMGHDTLSKGLFSNLYNKLQSMLGKIPVEKTISRPGVKAYQETYWVKPSDIKKDIHSPLAPGESRTFHSRQQLDKYFGIKTEHSPKGEYSPLKPNKSRLNKNSVTWWLTNGPLMKWLNKTDQTERQALIDYTFSSLTHPINSFLRRKIHPKDIQGKYYKDEVETIEQMITSMDSAIAKSELHEPITTYRQIRRYDPSTNEDLLSSFLSTNGLYKDGAFVSTTPVEGSFTLDADSVINLRIKVPAGKGIAAYIAPISNISSENELLLRRDLTFSVLTDMSKINKQDKNIMIDLEVVIPDNPPEDIHNIHQDQLSNIKNENF